MENENDILDEELEEEAIDYEIEAEEPAEDEEGADDEAESAEEGAGGFNIDDLEYDENGEIIIPDETAEETSSEDVENKEEPKEPERDDPKDATIAELRRELEDLKAQGRDTLKKLGVDTEDVMDGLVHLAAETDGDSKEEYLRKRDEARAKAAAEAAADQATYEQIAAQDLAELQAKYPETKAYKHVKDMPAEILSEYAKYRDLGLSAEKAYAAANPDGIRQSVATSVKREVSGKEHLQSNVPKGSKSSAVKITAAQMEEWRGYFPGKSDKEIAALFRKTAKNLT